jgi:hypothetical protein
MPQVALRWTLGDVGLRGFEALQFSIWGAYRIFGAEASYCVCVNTICLDRARALAAQLPCDVAFRDSSDDLPAWVLHYMGQSMAEGCAWKLAPVRLFPEQYELSLDNDCILWQMPHAMRQWLDHGGHDVCLMAEDVRPAFGIFADLCPSQPRNAGIRGMPPGFDFERALLDVLQRKFAQGGPPPTMNSELDEQGLQTAALSLHASTAAVSLDDVSICSPFWPHQPHLGRCGAHFVGLNARHIPWDYYGRPADDWMLEHWARHRPTLTRNVGLLSATQPEAICVP